MLLKLMRKDLILHWRGIVPLPLTMAALLVYAVLSDGNDLNPGHLLTMAALVTGFIPVVVAAREDRLKTRALTYSLPVRRIDAVAAHYVGAWIVLAACEAFCLVLFLSLRGPEVISRLIPAPTVFGVLTAYTLTVALLMPFVERFGFLGVFVALIALQVLGLAAMVLSMLFPAARIIGAVIEAARSLSSAARRRLGVPTYYVMYALALASIYAASFAASVAVLQRKEI